MSSTPTAPLLRRLRCPNCWQEFRTEDVLAIASDPSLKGDPLLGSHEPVRFSPDRFNLKGQPIDARGKICTRLACPKCHLRIPRALLEMPLACVSILGAPSAGKSYFLTSAIHRLRTVLDSMLHISFEDSEPAINQILTDYENTLFHSTDPNRITALAKTEKEGELYAPVLEGEHPVWYPSPFMFTLRPGEKHPRHDKTADISYVLCLYDNAGEHFLPQQNNESMTQTRHLAYSEALVFLFDPLQHAKFRLHQPGESADPQWDIAKEGRQDMIITEAANRIRSELSLSEHDKIDRPLIVAVTKCDAWWPLMRMPKLPVGLFDRPLTRQSQQLLAKAMHDISGKVRELLYQYARDVVFAAERLSQEVIYVPLSSLGGPPEYDEVNQFLGVRPRNVRPLWAEAPLLYALSRLQRRLIPSFKLNRPTDSR